MKLYAILITVVALGISSCAANQGMTHSAAEELRLEIKELKTSLDVSNAKLASLESKRQGIEEQKIRLALLKKELDKNTEALKELKKAAYEIKEPAGLKVVKLRGEKKGGPGSAGKTPAAAKKASFKDTKVAVPKGSAVKKDKPPKAVSKKKSASGTPYVATAAFLKNLKTLSIKALYDEGLRLYNAENYSNSRTAFELLIEKSPVHRLADNALYWVAETYYAQTSYVKAIESFNGVAKRYPDSNKTPDSILKIGYSYLELENHVKAKSAFNKLIEIYPDTQAAGRAGEWLDKSRN